VSSGSFKLRGAERCIGLSALLGATDGTREREPGRDVYEIDARACRGGVPATAPGDP